MAEVAEPSVALGHPAAPARPEFSIVPLAGIPFIVIALVGLVAAIESNSLWGLTFFHVVGGGLWTGVDLFEERVTVTVSGDWLVASYIVVGIMAVVAIGVLEPANLTVLFELKKPHPNGQLIASQMRRFVYTAGITGAMQVATLVALRRLLPLIVQRGGKALPLNVSAPFHCALMQPAADRLRSARHSRHR